MTEVQFQLVLALAVMGLLNVAQFVFWGIYTSKLANKLMSRNFYEYDAVANPKPVNMETREFSEYEDDIEEQEILNELNGMVGAKGK